MIKRKDRFSFSRGVFKLYSIDSEGRTEIIEDEDNTIVDSAFQIITGCMLGDVNKQVNTIAFGDGGISGNVRQSPNILDLYLSNETFRKEEYEDVIIESILKPYYISFKFVLNENEGNGVGAALYNEAGLFSKDGTLFARKTFREAIKTAEKKFIVEWKLEYYAESK